MNRLLYLLFALLACWGGLAHSQDFLDPDAAFKFSARAIDANTLEASWQIADGYYLYRHKLKFAVSDATLGTPVYPPSTQKDDDTYGKVDIYRKLLRVALPVEHAPGASSVKLTVTYQGCADAGLCYTPITLTQQVALPAAAPAAPAASGAKAPSVSAAPSSGLASLAAFTGLASLGAAPQILPPDRAFSARAALADAQTLVVHYGLTANTYLYRDKLQFAIKSPADIRIAQTQLPTADVKQDPSFGRTEVYHRDFDARLGLSRALRAGETLVFDAVFQGCNEKAGVCYPPITKPFTLLAASGAPAANPPAVTATTASPTPSAATAPASDAASAAPQSETNQIESVLKGGSFVAVLATFFGFGLLLALTPCVFPMIPILSGIIAGQKQVTKTSGFFLALAYVLGMAITYALAGVAAALSGTLISNALQNPWALGIGALVFVALALSMFGFFELQLPSSVQSRFSDASNKMKGGSVIGVFVMGALSAVIVGPCVAPPLAAALAFIAQTGNTVLGGAALFVLALGMGVPLLLIGLSAGALLPRAGGWMNAVKYFFGVLMLAIAVYLVSPILPAWIGMLLWALLLIVPAVYLSVLDPLPPQASGWRRLWKGIGVILLAGGLALVAGVLGGGRDVLQPLGVFARGNATASGAAQAGVAHAVQFERVKSVAELDARVAAAKGRPVMLDFYADWCVSCKEMERYTFSDARVQARLANVLLLQADVTASSDDDKALLKRFALFGPPGLIFWNAAGHESAYKVIGYEPPEKFLTSLDAVLK
jgi:thiol:disulfide interchange protein DsbD